MSIGDLCRRSGRRLDSGMGRRGLPKKGEMSSDAVIIYDGHKLACIPRVLDTLKVRRINQWERHGSHKGALPFYRKSVTRTFPQQFFEWLERPTNKATVKAHATPDLDGGLTDLERYVPA